VASEPNMTECPSCHRQVPAGEFCGACGAHLVSGSAGRLHAFAAHPGEHLLHPGVVSTLFPHLPHRHAAPFRLALVGGAALLLLLAVLGLNAAAIAVACLVVPVLYIVYLYETEVYEDEPALVIGLTFVMGLVLGVPWTWLTGPYITSTVVLNAISNAGLGRDLVVGVVLPLSAQVIMLIGPAALYKRHYDEAMDGFAFGAACALGFTFSVNLVDLWPQLDQGAMIGHATVDGTWAILGRGLLLPFVAASTTGLISASLWLRRGKMRVPQAHGWTTTLPVITCAVALIWTFLGLVNLFVSSITTDVTIYAAIAAVLLFAVRISIHHMLLAEAVEVTIGPEMVCSHCHYTVPCMAFCPHCGIATRATPKAGRGRLLRAFR
jgi:RsiW-degrading membrane proteinase PrsW (M82 family)